MAFFEKQRFSSYTLESANWRIYTPRYIAKSKFIQL
jgi:hypothetical protein